MSASPVRSLLILSLALFLCGMTLPAAASSCHAHAHSHDQCRWHTISQSKTGVSSLSCDANTNTPGVHSHAFANVDCFLFFCSKVIGGHAWWKNGCGAKHYWWHAKAGTGHFMVVGDGPTAEIEVVIPRDPPDATLPPATGLVPPRGALARQGLSAAADAVVSMNLRVGIRMPDGDVVRLVEGEARLGGPRSRVPGLRASPSLRNVLRTSPGDRVNRAGVGRDFVSRRVEVPTHRKLEFLFDLEADVGGDDPEEDSVPFTSPPEGEHPAGAASLGATLRLVDQSGRFVLHSLDTKRSEEYDEIGPARGSPGAEPKITCFLKCVVQGTPVEFPNDIWISNVGPSTCPQDASISWTAASFSGVEGLDEPLPPGAGLSVRNVLSGGLEAGTECSANLVP